MLKIKHSKLSKKEIKEISGFLYDLQDLYLDFYITRDNLRLFIKENFELVAKNLQKGDYIIYNTNETGVLFILGYSDKFDRKYIKLLAKDVKSAGDLLGTLSLEIKEGNIKEDLYIKINKHNPLIDTLQYYGFEPKAGRGKELLMVRRYNHV